jgi:hypothetical protein
VKRCFARRWTEEGLRLNDPLWYGLSLPRPLTSAITSSARSVPTGLQIASILLSAFFLLENTHTPLEHFLASPAVVWL